MPALSRHKNYFLFVIVLSFLTLVSGCATQKGAPIWHSGDQYVSLTSREGVATGQGVPNRQPVSLPARTLRAELAALTVELPGDPRPTAVFGKEELDVLSEQLHAGLERAGKDQDLVFAVVGEKPLWKAFGSLPVVTTGRVFYGENGLNVILGTVRREFRGDDRRLDPFVPGSRFKEAALPGPVLLDSKQAPHLPDRPDWLVLTVATTAPTPASATPERAKEAVPVPRQEGGAATAAGKIEERLKVLDELKAKGLITDEEYRAKRKSILNEL